MIFHVICIPAPPVCSLVFGFSHRRNPYACRTYGLVRLRNYPHSIHGFFADTCPGSGQRQRRTKRACSRKKHKASSRSAHCRTDIYPIKLGYISSFRTKLIIYIYLLINKIDGSKKSAAKKHKKQTGKRPQYFTGNPGENRLFPGKTENSYFYRHGTGHSPLHPNLRGLKKRAAPPQKSALVLAGRGVLPGGLYRFTLTLPSLYLFRVKSKQAPFTHSKGNIIIINIFIIPLYLFSGSEREGEKSDEKQHTRIPPPSHNPNQGKVGLCPIF